MRIWKTVGLAVAAAGMNLALSGGANAAPPPRVPVPAADSRAPVQLVHDWGHRHWRRHHWRRRHWRGRWHHRRRWRRRYAYRPYYYRRRGYYDPDGRYILYRFLSVLPYLLAP